MSACAPTMESRLHRFHDGELRGLGRWRMERHVARCARCQEELRGLEALSALVRESELAAPGPDLWEAISAELPALDTRRRAHAREQAEARRRPWWVPVGAGAAVAVLVVGLVVSRMERSAGVAPPTTASTGVVRSLYAPAGSVVVLERPDDTTIIWVVDHPSAERTEGGHLEVG